MEFDKRVRPPFAVMDLYEISLTTYYAKLENFK